MYCISIKMHVIFCRLNILNSLNFNKSDLKWFDKLINQTISCPDKY